MESLYLLVPVSVALVFAAIWVFFRMSDSGQFDDMIGPSMRILHDDDSVHEIEDVPGAGEITKSPNHQIAKSPNHINQ